jgi:hypothetical protein
MEVKAKPRAAPMPTGPMRTPRVIPGSTPGVPGPASPPVLAPPGAVPDLPDD